MAVMAPTAVADLPRTSSAMSGFFLWGIADDPVATESASLAQPNSEVVHRTISSARRERWSIVWVALNAYSATKSRDATASSVFDMTRSKPRASAVAFRSSGNDDPALAPAPSGDSETRARRSEEHT